MIKIITGVPGAGKTYLAVKLLVDQYFTYNKELQDYVKKPKYKDYTIITNIDEFLLHDFDLNDLFVKSKMTFKEFFTVPYQEKITKKYGKIIYVIDECQSHIGKFFRDTQTIYYFDYHRHLDHEIYLISQHSKKICSDIVFLTEFEYRAVKQTLSLVGELKYNIISGGEIFQRKAVKRDKKIFNLYKSAISNEQSKTKNPLMKTIIILICLSLICIYMLKKRMLRNVDKQPPKPKVESIQNPTIPSRSIKKNKNQMEKNRKLAKERKLKRIDESNRWLKTSAIVQNRSFKTIIHPISKSLIPKEIYPYRIKRYTKLPDYGIITIYTLLPSSELEKKAQDRNIDPPDSSRRVQLFSDLNTDF